MSDCTAVTNSPHLWVAYFSLAVSVSCGVALAHPPVFFILGPGWKQSYCLRRATPAAERKFRCGGGGEGGGPILALNLLLDRAHVTVGKAGHVASLKSVGGSPIREGRAGVGLVERVVSALASSVLFSTKGLPGAEVCVHGFRSHEYPDLSGLKCIY